MGSESRRRTRILTVRLYEPEDAWLVAQIGAVGNNVTRADLARHILFGTPLDELRPTLACSSHHLTCTNHHAAQVAAYRDLHNHETMALERETGGYAGDTRIWRENGGRLTTYADWLKANRGQ